MVEFPPPDRLPHMSNNTKNAVRYTVALCGTSVKVDGTHYVEGNVFDRRDGLLKSEVSALPTMPDRVWLTVGWSNPLAPNGWLDA